MTVGGCIIDRFSGVLDEWTHSWPSHLKICLITAPRSSCDLINSRYVCSISNFCTKCWLSDSNGWYRDVLSQTFCLAFSGQNVFGLGQKGISVPGVLSRDRKAYLCFSYLLSNGHRLRDTGWLIRPGWFSRWRNLCVQQKIRTSVRFCL